MTPSVVACTWPRACRRPGLTVACRLSCRWVTCTGYLDHPFKNRLFETEKDFHPPLANTGGSVYNSKSSPHPHARTMIHLRDGEVFVMAGVLTSLQRLLNGCWHALSSRLTHWTEPLRTSLLLATLADLSRSKSELLA